MATHREAVTRALSEDASSVSNITVAGGAHHEDDASDRVSASTPPTSLADSGTTGSDKKRAATEEDASTLRPKRNRSAVSSYNVNKLAATQESDARDARASANRNISGLTGRTLVGDGDDDSIAFPDKMEQDAGMEWDSTTKGKGKGKATRGLQRRPTVKDKVKKAVGNVRSVLGKRGRDVMEAGKRTFGLGEDSKQNRILKQLDTGKRGVLDELDLDQEYAYPRPAKKARLSKSAAKEIAQPAAVPATLPKATTEATKRMKKWQREGLYVGQPEEVELNKNGTRKKLQKKRPNSSDGTMEDGTKKPFMTLPMFSYLDKTRDFTIPYDVYAPSFRKGDEKPKDWHQLNRNRLIGDAKDLWDFERLAASACSCLPSEDEDDPGCGDQCWNRIMQYECNDTNCNLRSDQCTNREFTELTKRVKKGGAYDVGVEVVKTPNRGFGVRACRTFAPHQIIMEYTGEVISEGECQRRMREEYMDKQCYYLMELERGLIIDGTRGSMARFINHSCEPNCEVRMVKVNNVPRMGVFAGENGITTGQELSYDYNFDNFGTTRQICYCGAPSCRGFLSQRLNAAEQKKQDKEAAERRQKEEEAAAKAAAKEARRQKVKADRGSAWRGWIAVDDPETKERLRREKKEREEAEKNSIRAQRLAARRTSLPTAGSKPVGVTKPDTKRRRTTTVAKMTEDEDKIVPVAKKGGRQPRQVSAASNITVERPTTGQSNKSIVKGAAVSVSEAREGSIRSEENVFLLVADNTGDSKKKTTVANKRRSFQGAATKGRDAVKTAGRAVRDSLTGSSANKMRQSTLSFNKIE